SLQARDSCKGSPLFGNQFKRPHTGHWCVATGLILDLCDHPFDDLPDRPSGEVARMADDGIDPPCPKRGTQGGISVEQPLAELRCVRLVSQEQHGFRHIPDFRKIQCQGRNGQRLKSLYLLNICIGSADAWQSFQQTPGGWSVGCNDDSVERVLVYV